MSLSNKVIEDDAASSSEQQQLPIKVHSAWWHPHKSWTDVLLGYLCKFLFPLTAPPPPLLTEAQRESSTKNDSSSSNSRDNDDDDAELEHTLRMRRGLDRALTSGLSSRSGAYRQWAAKLLQEGTHLMQVRITISARDYIDTLKQQWGLLMPNSSDENENEDDMALLDKVLPAETQDITVLLTFPETLWPDDDENNKKPSTMNEFGCLVFDDEDEQSMDADIFSKLASPNVPTILYFHGGGMTIGNAHMTEGMELLTQTAANNKDVVFASVDYSMAPEHPFPIAPLQACVVVAHFLKNNTKNLHLMGVSAGAHLALVSALEACRNNSNSSVIKSLLLACPFVDPAADSLSYYQNSASSHLAPVEWLRYCWQAYLNLPPAAVHEDDDEKQENDTLHSVLGRHSNRTAWNQWKTASSSNKFFYHGRLIEPTITSSTANLPRKIIVTTNAADPLHDEGVALVEQLRTAAGAQNTKVLHQEDSGSHWIGTRFDKAAFQKLAVTWDAAIFGEEPDDDDDED